MKSYRAELVGAYGDPIDENPTGVMEEAAFAAAGLDYRYLTIRVKRQDLGAAMAAVRALNMRGINLTIPHKVEVLRYVDDLSDSARIIGAVNTIVNQNGKLVGDNTDGKGFLSALSDAGCHVDGKAVAILGAGGAARAIAVEAALAGAKSVCIINRSRERGEALAKLVRDRTSASGRYLPWEPEMEIPQDTDILVNATSVGLYPHVGDCPDMDYDTVTEHMVVSDVVFNDPNTVFLRQSASRGAKTVNGLGMLVHQGAVNFELWTGKKPDIRLMEDVLKKEFSLE